MEVSGHDHLSSLRYSTSADIVDLAATDADFFHNMMICPSMTPWYGNNPGMGVFEIDLVTHTPHGLK